MAAKTCEGFDKGKCKRPAKKGERYCPVCRAWKLRQMKRSGYLVQLPGESRDDDAPALDDDEPAGADYRSRYVPHGPWDGER